MAKKATVEMEPDPTLETYSEASPNTGGSVQGYFRPLFDANPHLLHERSNEALYQQWLLDHPGESEVPVKVRQCLSNLKSVLRKALGLTVTKPGRPKKETPAVPETAVAPPTRPTRGLLEQLEKLEHQIDEALAHAKHINRENLEDVIRHLRAARNRVVVLVGWE